MARPTKQGLDYFPFDVDFFEDEKIQAIGGEFGIKGELITVRLLCAIYRNGYYILWNDLLKKKLLRNLPGVTAELLDDVVNRLVKWGFFHEPLFNSEKVLTSNGIQKRYYEAAKRRKTELMHTYCIHKPPTNGINVDINPPKESKGKESKVDDEGTPPPIISPYLPLDDIKQRVTKDENFVAAFYRIGVKPEALPGWIDAFHRHLEFTGDKIKQEKDYRRHFGNWIAKIPYRTTKPEDYNPVKQQPQQQQNRKML